MRRLSLIPAFAAVATLALSLLTNSVAAQGTAYTAIDFPGAVFTLAADINNAGQIVGRYQDTAGINHGFLLSTGSFTTIDFPGAVFTRSLGINRGGDVVGDYSLTDAGGSKDLHGYLLHSGLFSSVDFPGANLTVAQGNNTGGQVVGFYQNSQGGHRHGFRLSAGAFSSVDMPGATQTEAWRINDVGEIAGRSQGNDNNFHVYVLSNGQFQTVNYPGAIQTAPGLFSHIGGLNNFGDVASDYCSSTPCKLDSVGNLHGFLFSGGSFTSFDVPGSAWTLAFGMNDDRDIVGGYSDAAGAIHGYLRTP